MKCIILNLPVAIVPFEFVFPDFLNKFSVYDWILPERTRPLSEEDDLNINLDYNSGMLLDAFELERQELEEIEENDYETSTILPDVELNESERRKMKKRYVDLPNLVPQIKEQYNTMDQTLLNMIAFSLDMNGIQDITAHAFSSYGCWCTFKTQNAHGRVIDEVDALCKVKLNKSFFWRP